MIKKNCLSTHRVILRYAQKLMSICLLNNIYVQQPPDLMSLVRSPMRLVWAVCAGVLASLPVPASGLDSGDRVCLRLCGC